MNFAASGPSCGRRMPTAKACWIIAALLPFIMGCGDQVRLPSAQELAAFESAGPIMPELDVDTLMAAQAAPRRYRVSQGDLLEIRMPGRLVEAEQPAAAHRPHQHLSRVDDDGQITLPIIGSLPAEGLLLPQLEADIVAAYYPRYTAQKPTIVVQVAEPQTAQVTITGAVRNPGIYDLPLHRMTLVAAIMAAGGIVDDGAAVVHINARGEAPAWHKPPNPTHSAAEDAPEQAPPLETSRIGLSFQQMDPDGRGIIHVKDNDTLLYAQELDVTDAQQRAAVIDRIGKAHPQVSTGPIAGRLCELAEMIQPGSGQGCQEPSSDPPADPDELELPYAFDRAKTAGSLILPVKDMNIPFSDVWLHEGASVTIEPLDPQVFTVIGLVQRPGAFDYPPGARFSLIDALGFAGGVNEVANPRYLRVYRRTDEGEIIDAAFEIRGTLPTSAATMLIKPGDVVAVEQTPRTRRNLILSQILRFNFGVMSYYRMDEL